MFRTSVNLALIATFACIAAGPGPRGKPRKRDGDYNISVAGCVKGAGSAKVQGDNVVIYAEVTDLGGSKGALSVNLPLNGDHFSGAGAMLGLKVTVRGRIDAPDLDKENALKLSRIVATVTTSDGRYAKLAGDLPGSGRPPGKAPGGVSPPPGPGPDRVEEHRRTGTVSPERLHR